MRGNSEEDIRSMKSSATHRTISSESIVDSLQKNKQKFKGLHKLKKKNIVSEDFIESDKENDHLYLNKTQNNKQNIQVIIAKFTMMFIEI